MRKKVVRTQLKHCVSKEEKDLIHEIREKVLFVGVPYDRNHPDDNNPQKHLFIFYVDENPASTLRIDFLRKNEAALRLVAVLPEFQGKGIGSEMLLKAEDYCKAKNIKKLVTNAKPDAIEFYKKWI